MKNLDHSINVTLKSGGDGITVEPFCHASPGSPCNQWCNEGCDYPDNDHDGHTLHPIDCMLVEWWGWDTAASIEGYVGPTTEPYSGPIEVLAWGEDGIEWQYADDGTASSDAPIRGDS